MASSYLRDFDEQLLFYNVLCEKSKDVSDWCHCLVADARLQVPITRHPCGVISINCDKKSNSYHKNDTFLTNTLEKVWDAGKESGKYHLLLMLLSTFGASLASTALRHCITIRWLSVGSATDGILLKTDFIFELPDIPDRKVPSLAYNALVASLGVITLLEDVD